MKFSNSNFYLETSAVNYFVDNYRWQDALATKGLQNVKGNLWYLSPVTLWEILLTSNIEKREQIIFFCQHLFHEKLLNSPSEFIINYINSGCPLVEKPYDFHSKLSIAETWADICADKRKTFVYDYNELKAKMKAFQKLSKQFDKIINRIVLDINVSDEELSIQIFINNFYEKIKGQLKYHDPDYHKVIKISILLAFYILCLGAEMDSTPIKTYWQKIGIKEPIDRLNYAMNMYNDLILRGPFYQMAIMVYHQTSIKKSNRGLFMDSLHSIYITYADIFLTNDDHFKTLREKDIHPNFSRLLHISDIQLTTQIRQIHNPHE